MQPRPAILTVVVAWAMVPGSCAAVADEATERLQRLLDGMTAYRAEFEQTVKSRFGDVLQVSSGTLHLQRPRRLRWEVDEPYPQLVVTDGSSVWIYDPDLEQVTVQPFSETVEGTPAMFLADTAELEEHFVVQAGSPEYPGESRFVLVPLEISVDTSPSLFRSLTLAFSATGLLTGLQMLDHLDQATEMTFRGGVHNPVLESEVFVFEVPEGIDVIGNVPDNVPAKSPPG